MSVKNLFENFLLMESEKKLDFLKDKHDKEGGFDTTHDTEAKHRDTNDIVDHFAKKADHTPNKQYTQWVLDQYKKQHIRQEDAPQIKKDLKDFEKAKPHLEKKDIGQYKHIADLRDATASKLQVAKDKEKEKQQDAKDKEEEMPKIYDQDGVTAYKIPNKKASIHNYGINGKMAKTNWCTAANSKDNMFNNYTGGKYTMHFPNGRALQFHHQSGQIMDERDRPISPGHEAYKDHEHHIYNVLKQTHAVENQPGKKLLSKFKTYTPEEADEVMKKHFSGEGNYHDRDEAESVVKRHNISEDHRQKMFDAAHKHIKENDGKPSYFNTDYKMLSSYLGDNPHISEEEYDKVHDDEHIKKTSLPSVIRNNDNVSSKIIHKIIDRNGSNWSTDKDLDSFGMITRKNNFDDEHAKKLLNLPSHEAHLALVESGKLSRDHHAEVLKRSKEIEGQDNVYTTQYVVNQLLNKNKNVHPDIIDHAIKHWDDHHEELLQHMNSKDSVESFKPHHYEKILDKINNDLENRGRSDRFSSHSKALSHIMHAGNEGSDIHGENAKNIFLNHFHKSPASYSNSSANQILGSSKLSKEDLDHAWHNTNTDSKIHRSFRNAMVGNAKIGDDKIHEHIDKHGSSAMSEILKNKKVKPEHLTKLAKHSSYIDPILDHPKFGHQEMNAAFESAKSHDTARTYLHHEKSTETMQRKALEKPHMHGHLSTSPYAMPSVLKELAKSKMPHVRLNVAAHKNTPNEVVHQLKNDPHHQVSEMAKKKAK